MLTKSCIIKQSLELNLVFYYRQTLNLTTRGKSKKVEIAINLMLIVKLLITENDVFLFSGKNKQKQKKINIIA